MVTKAVCPRCGTPIEDGAYQGGIAICQGEIVTRVEVTDRPGYIVVANKPCGWRGNYPKRVPVKEGGKDWN